MEIFLVGGAVRDELLGKPVKDRDWVVVGAQPSQMIALGYQPVGESFPVFLHPKTHEEYALARTERKVGKGYKGFTFYCEPTVTLEEDLRRRDLTINAIAKTPEGEYIDPYDGLKDIQQRKLRHVSEAFVEDPVRVLRVARFAARFHIEGFTIAEETSELMASMVANGEVDALVPERVWQEIEKTLSGSSSWIFFEVLHRCGALARLMPELDALWGVPNPPKYHPEIDTGIHTLLVLEQACLLSSDPVTRFAALLHDLGKGITPEKYWPKHHGHEESGVALVKQLCQRLKVPNSYKSLALLVCQYHGHVHRAKELRSSTMVKLFTSLDAFRKPERFRQFLLACRADAQGRPGFETLPYPQSDILQEAFDAVAHIDALKWVEEGLKGEAIKNAVFEERVRVLDHWRASNRHE